MICAPGPFQALQQMDENGSCHAETLTARWSTTCRRPRSLIPEVTCQGTLSVLMTALHGPGWRSSVVIQTCRWMGIDCTNFVRTFMHYVEKSHSLWPSLPRPSSSISWELDMVYTKFLGHLVSCSHDGV